MTTKLLNSVLLVMALMAALPAGAYDFMIDGIAYNKNSDGTSVSVTSTGTDPNYKDLEHINILPQVSYGGKSYQVTAIGYYGLCGASNVKSVSLPEGIVSIGECGMNSLENISELTLPSTLTTVGGWAFENIFKANSITCLAKVAPSVDGFWFHNYERIPTCPFYVPKGSLASYKASSYWNAFNLQEMEDPDIEDQYLTTHIGIADTYNEWFPICNWWLGTYQGNESLYVKEDLGMSKGDKIVALSYNCLHSSASGGNFNVRLKNTDISAFKPGEHARDVSVIELGYDDKVYGNVSLAPYSAGDWVTFPLDEPFVYEGENIIVDIRNTAPASRSGWVYFASTHHDDKRSIAWINAYSEDVSSTGWASDGFVGDLASSNPDLADIIITYIPSDNNASIRLNRTYTSLVVGDSEQLVASVTLSGNNKEVSWKSSNTDVVTVDQNGNIAAVAVGNAIITATVKSNPDLKAECRVAVISPIVPGDVDGNGVVNGSDVTSLYYYLMDGTRPIGEVDVNGDGIVNGSDITALYNTLLYGK